jgi:hypothetical protein
MSCLDYCFLLGASGSLYLFHYAVFLAKVCGGTYTLAASNPSHVHRARYLLDKGGFGAYSLFKNSCENFAI